MDEKRLIRSSKRLSHCLRHDPARYGVKLDAAGWVEIDVLLAALDARGTRLTRDELQEIVDGNDKRRFALSADGRRIRASQGHSVPVDLGYEPQEPPPVLYHGTVGSSLDAIFRDGLRAMNRHDVHLSGDVATALRVGNRRGRPVVLAVDAARLHADGAEFRRSANGVWLVAEVPPGYLTVHGGE
ncbi:RNA 2'-phosphotransferase [Streptomyces sp. NPDC051940]|uniref:RNA 2'-phosphotransferase n=1 Tax=Streptomyces sp. NPDC051940 TaxID=3155675 RepID=UPI00343D6359